MVCIIIQVVFIMNNYKLFDWWKVEQVTSYCYDVNKLLIEKKSPLNKLKKMSLNSLQVLKWNNA